VSDQTRTRPPDDAPVPADVTDLLLWRLGVDVAAAHQPGPDGRCRSLLCATETGPCAVFRAAQRAMHLARTSKLCRRAPRSTVTARGSAPVPVMPSQAQAAGWFTRSPAPPHRPVAEPNPPPDRLPAITAPAA
jgi:hypothetical protein